MGCAATKPLDSSHGLQAAQLDVLFFDCDDTLYFNDWATAIRLKDKISEFTSRQLGLDDEYAFELYQKYGTALRGLLEENLLPEDRVEQYLHLVHNVPLAEIQRNLELREMLLRVNCKRWVFTASTREHANRCLKRVGVEDLFEGVVDCRTVQMKTKHDPESFGLAMRAAGVTDPSRCMLFDDSVQNMKTAREMGWKTCLVGTRDRFDGSKIVCPDADFAIDRLIDLEMVLPGLLLQPKQQRRKSLAMINGKRYSTVSRRRFSSSAEASPKPQVVFVLGGPGCGKGTQCALAKDEFQAVHLSAGDLLRQEQNNPNSTQGALIAKYMTEGTIVPVEITIELILKAIFSQPTPSGNKPLRILLDGFPRSNNNLDGWNRMAFDDVDTLGVLYFEVDDEQELVRRIIERGKTSGREDDNAEVLAKRFATMKTQTVPVVQRLEQEHLPVKRVNALGTVDDVWANVRLTLGEWWR
ncbi:pyrimidine 5'-nucleotidase [Batrachochytrium salamandrivorans]|nr:pyrimidine 5'-nucleotidase [Batrachochytrium salamandrivorans]